MPRRCRLIFRAVRVALARTMIGYHGTTETVASVLEAGTPFSISRRAGDWLGFGAYFFCDHPASVGSAEDLARGFAERWYAPEPVAVVTVNIAEDRVMDLVSDRRAQEIVREVRRRASASKLASLPANTGWHHLDRYLVDEACQLQEEAGHPVSVVRALLDDYPPLYTGTAIITNPHVQVAVRELSALSDLAVVR